MMKGWKPKPDTFDQKKGKLLAESGSFIFKVFKPKHEAVLWLLNCGSTRRSS